MKPKRLDRAWVWIQLTPDWVVRLKYRWQLWKDSANELKRRVEVESELFDAATGKRPLPDAKQCREWAMRLGIPDECRMMK